MITTERPHALIGHVALSSISSGTHGVGGWILAPLGVDPNHQGQGVGRALVQQALSHGLSNGDPLVLVYGDPAYYGQFGFTTESARRFTPPFSLAHPIGWQAIDNTSPGGENHISIPVRCHPALMHAELW